MSTLRVEVSKVDEVLTHPNADKLSLARIKGWIVVIKKDEYKAGDNVVYFPIDSILPVELSDKLKCTQYLTSQRIRAARLRGVVSCGLLGPNEGNWPLETDLTEHYAVQKWEPPAPRGSTGGQNRREPGPFHHYTGIENWNNYPNVFEDGEEIIAAEKIHGTNWRAGIIADEFVVGSHYNAKQLDERIVYWQAALRYDVEKLMRDNLPSGNWVLFGEVFGAVQDLRYGLGKEISLRVFDLSLDGRYLDYDDFLAYAGKMNLPVAPELYRGPYSKELVEDMCQGNTTFDADHIREGIVIRPVKERWHPRLHRVILKKINPEYLVRKGGTEGH